MEKEKKYNVTVDVLKCYAAALVFVCHSYIACNAAFSFEFNSSWQFILKAPAWVGVWIFMIVSGFLAGNGFFAEKYTLTQKGIRKYYKTRFLNVIAPTWVMISIVYILADPQIPSVSIICRFLTCMFRGGDAADGVGATWYVFTVAWLYLLTPLFVFISQKIEGRYCGKETRIYFGLLSVLAVLGMFYRVVGRLSGLTWYRWIYASPLGNIDLFWGGLVISRIRYFLSESEWQNEKCITDKIRKATGAGILIATLFCAYCYFYGESTKPILLSVYRYLMPTAFLSLGGGYCLAQRNVSVTASVTE